MDTGSHLLSVQAFRKPAKVQVTLFMGAEGRFMSVTVEANDQNGAFKSVQPVSLPEGTKVRLVITPVADQDAATGVKAGHARVGGAGSDHPGAAGRG